MLRPLFFLLLAFSAPAQDTAEADKRIVQTVQRLSSFDYAKASAKTKEAIDRYLTANAGSDEYFQLVEKFGVISQKETLVKLAAEQAGTPPGGQAVKLLFQLGQGSAVEEKLAVSGDLVDRIRQTLAVKLGENEIDGDVYGRVKSVYSIWSKMRRHTGWMARCRRWRYIRNALRTARLSAFWRIPSASVAAPASHSA